MRVMLNGLGQPIPPLALPDLSLSDDVPPFTFQLGDGDVFNKADWLAFGYTHVDVWCFGAAGGRGGDAGTDVSFPYRSVGGVTHWFSPFLSSLQATGGAGGGGGLHRVTIPLDDLPDSCDVVVGQPGVDAPAGYIDNNGVPYTPDPPYSPGSVYDLPHVTFLAPVAGGDGGASSFGDICMASGGKGGLPVEIGPTNPFIAGHRLPLIAGGGQGGIGGQVLAGGGATGSPGSDVPWNGHDMGPAPVNGSDGGWDGVVGQGGGGGRGGRFNQGTAPPPGPGLPYTYSTDLASSGGQGSFSFGDTSVYGPRMSRGDRVYTPDTTYVPPDSSTNFVKTYPQMLGGGGGGAHRNESKFGSKAPGYLPQAAAIVRIFKIV